MSEPVYVPEMISRGPAIHMAVPHILLSGQSTHAQKEAVEEGQRVVGETRVPL